MPPVTEFQYIGDKQCLLQPNLLIHRKTNLLTKEISFTEVVLQLDLGQQCFVPGSIGVVELFCADELGNVVLNLF